jgi:hypothetical protein
MTTKHCTYEVELSLGSFLYLAALIGLSGGLVLGLLAFLYSIVQAEWIDAVSALFFSPMIGMFWTVIYGLLGYPIYRRLSRRAPSARELNGTFLPAIRAAD